MIDIYPSATAELADVVLPCTDMYERDDLNIVNIGTSARPFAQYTPAVVEPAGRSPAGVVDRPSPAAGARRAVDPRRRRRPTRGRSGGTCWQRGRGRRARRPPGDRRRPRAAGAGARASSSTQQVQTADGRVDCCPPSFAERASSAATTCSPRSPRDRRRPAAADPRPRRLDAQHVVRQRAADEARRPDVQPAVHQPRPTPRRSALADGDRVRRDERPRRGRRRSSRSTTS